MKLQSVPTKNDTLTEAIYFDHEAPVEYHHRVGGNSFRFKVDGINPASKQAAKFTLDITTRQVMGCLLEMNADEIGTWIKLMTLEKDIAKLPDIVKALAVAIRDIGGPKDQTGRLVTVGRDWNGEQQA